MSEDQKVKFRDRFPEYLEKELGEAFDKQNDKTSLLSGYKLNRFNWLQLSSKSLSQPIS